MIKKWLARLLTAAMLVGLLPAWALAVDENISSTGLTINNETEASQKAGNYTAGDGTVVVAYDTDSQTVTFTMNNAMLSGSLNISGINAQLNLTGENSISTISVNDGNLTISGQGKLTADSEYAAIYSANNIVVDGSTVTANSSEGNGFSAGNNIVLKNGATISGECYYPVLLAGNNIQIQASCVNNVNVSNGWGIWADGSLTISEDSNVNVNAYTGAIGASCEVSIANSSVIATSDGGVGLLTYNSLTISGTETVVTATSKAESFTDEETGGEYSFPGILSWEAISISGGKVNASADDAHGIQSFGSLEISGANTEVNISNTSDNFFALRIGGDITINGGKTTVVSTGNEGIYPQGDLELLGGSLSVTSQGNGIYMPDNDVAISGGELKIITTGDDGSGILCNTMSISGGTVSIECSDYQKPIRLPDNNELSYTGGILLLPNVNQENSLQIGSKEYFLVEFDAQNDAEKKSILVEKNQKIITNMSDPEKENYTFAGWYNAASGGTAWDFANDTVTIHMTLYAQWSSANAGVTAVSVAGATGIISGRTINVELPAGTNLTTDSSKISITPADGNASVSAPVTNDNGKTWTFTVTAEDGTTTATYTINVTVAPHVHDWVDEWSSDSGYHWHECTVEGCSATENSEKGGYAAHTPGEWIIDQPAAAAEAGSRHRECTVCGYNMGSESISATGSGEDPTPSRKPNTGGGSSSSNKPGEPSASDPLPPTVEPPKGGGGAPEVYPSDPKRGDSVTVTPKPGDGYRVDKVTVTDQDGNPVAVVQNPDGTFRFTQPAGTVTIEVSYVPLSGFPSGSWVNPFTDVSESDWFYNAVGYVVQNGLFSGTSVTTILAEYAHDARNARHGALPRGGYARYRE